MIEKYIIKDKGFHPFIIRDGWQVALLNYIGDQHIDNIKKIDVHFETDEIFILINGEAVLISAAIENDNVEFRTELMKQGIVYNIPKSVWHNVAMREGSEILIVEKSNTHLGDYEFYYLTKEQISQLRNIVNGSFDEKN